MTHDSNLKLFLSGRDVVEDREREKQLLFPERKKEERERRVKPNLKFCFRTKFAALPCPDSLSLSSFIFTGHKTPFLRL